MVTAPSWFPPGKTGGLIEATPPPNSSQVQPASFRRVKPAASLKHRRVQQHPKDVAGGFRRVKPAASLKLDQRIMTDALADQVSAG